METMKDFERELEASFRKIKVGDIIKGTVISINEEEVVLDLRYYTQGIIRAEDISNDPGFMMLEEIHPEDEIEATVISMDDGQGNILLSKKEATAVLAWDILKEYMEQEHVLSVKVNEAVNGGVVAYAEGIRGFIPASQMDMSYVEDTSGYVGKKLQVKITEVNKEKEKLILSAKAVLKEAAKEEHAHKVAMIVPGTVLEGVVESLQPYGAFVDLQDGINGLVHISQICQKRIRKPSEVLSVGDKVKVKVLNTNDGKVSLSIKAVEEDVQAQEMEELETENYSSNENIGTGLGDLLAKLKL